MKYLFVALSVFLFFACHSGSGDKAAAANSATVTEKDSVPPNFKPYFAYGNPKLRTYDAYLAGLDTGHINTAAALQKFKELFAGTDPNVADTGYYLFDLYQASLCVHLDGLTVSMGNLASIMRDSNNAHPIGGPVRVREFGKVLRDNGFLIDQEEEQPFIDQDFQFAIDRLSTYVTPAMRQFLEQLRREEAQGFEQDAGIEINAATLASRTVWWEEFRREHSKFIYTAYADSNYKTLMTVLVNGVDNTPLTETSASGDTVLAAYYKDAYSYLADRFPTAKTTAILTPYFKAWMAKDTATIGSIRRKYFIN